MDPLHHTIELPMSQAALDAFQNLSPAFMANLTVAERLITLNVFLHLDFASKGTKIPRQLQILAAIAVHQGKDLLVRSGTGSGKTLVMIIPLLLQDKKAVAITISLLRLIQDNHVTEFAKYGIPSIAINCFTPDDPALWTSLRNHELYRHYSVSPEQCSPYQGHIPKFAKLLRDPKWAKAVKLLQIDEAHFIVTTGQSKGKEGAFLPAFSDLGERVRVHLPSSTVCTAYSASMPTRIHDVLMKTLRMDPNNTVKVELSTNCPNLIHATIPMVGGLNDFNNLNFLLPTPPKCIVFIDDKKKAGRLARHLNNSDLLSQDLKGKRPFREFHSGMSKPYLEETIAAFRSGNVLGLIATESASNGFDVPDIRLIVIDGVPKSMYEEDQRAGRGGRDEKECLVLTIAEPWAFNNSALTDPDHEPDKKELRTEKGVIEFASTKQCRRKMLAKHNDDNTSQALDFTTKWCCDNHDDGFDLAFYLPSLRPQLSDDSDSELEQPPKRPRKRYRTVALREPLVSELEEWRQKVHTSDPVAKDFPIGYILDDKAISLLARELPGAFRIPADITAFLEETPEWHSLYALDVLGTIRLHDADPHVSSSESDRTDASKSSGSDSDHDEIRRPTPADAATTIDAVSRDSTPSSTRPNSPDAVAPPPAPAFTSSGRPLRQAAINHTVAGIAVQVSKRRKVAEEDSDDEGSPLTTPCTILTISSSQSCARFPRPCPQYPPRCSQ
ncbi:hypothetical protein C8R46DRAFT_925038 [Mycena filopes]|nr:hypothetical protein C8R46DRAFT_925038 [Mycena filopes]